VRRGGGRTRKGSEKEGSSSSNQGKKDFSHTKCFKCHKEGHYASQCLKKKEGKGKQKKQLARSVETSIGVDELESRLETSFSKASCLSTSNVLGCGQWSI
jgi:hypothetical protein